MNWIRPDRFLLVIMSDNFTFRKKLDQYIEKFKKKIILFFQKYEIFNDYDDYDSNLFYLLSDTK